MGSGYSVSTRKTPGWRSGPYAMIDEQITVLRGLLLRASSKIAMVPSILTALMRGGLAVANIKPEPPPAGRIKSGDGSAQSAAKASGAPRATARYSAQYPVVS